MAHSPLQTLQVWLKEKFNRTGLHRAPNAIWRRNDSRAIQCEEPCQVRAVAGPGDAHLGKVLLLQLPLPPCAAKSTHQPAYVAPLRTGTSADVPQSLTLTPALGTKLQAVSAQG